MLFDEERFFKMSFFEIDLVYKTSIPFGQFFFYGALKCGGVSALWSRYKLTGFFGVQTNNKR